MLWIILAMLTVALFTVAVALSETQKHKVKACIILLTGFILFAIQAIWGPKY